MTQVLTLLGYMVKYKKNKKQKQKQSRKLGFLKCRTFSLHLGKSWGILRQVVNFSHNPLFNNFLKVSIGGFPDLVKNKDHQSYILIWEHHFEGIRSDVLTQNLCQARFLWFAICAENLKDFFQDCLSFWWGPLTSPQII